MKILLYLIVGLFGLLSLNPSALADSQHHRGRRIPAETAYNSNGRDPVVRQVQLALEQRGYDVGLNSGEFVYETRRAIRRFRAKHGLHVNGKIDGELLSPRPARGVARPVVRADRPPRLTASAARPLERFHSNDSVNWATVPALRHRPMNSILLKNATAVVPETELLVNIVRLRVRQLVRGHRALIMARPGWAWPISR